jgi:hypothetical protein
MTARMATDRVWYTADAHLIFEIMTKMSKKLGNTARSKQFANEPRLIGSVIEEMLNENELFRDIFPQSEFGVDLKLMTRRQGRMKMGDCLSGMITRDGGFHYTFIENDNDRQVKVAVPNPHIYRGKYINVNRGKDGRLYPTFKRPVYTRDFNFRDFCLHAAEELKMALGFVEKKAILGEMRMN